jgi:hypothetical protein
VLIIESRVGHHKSENRQDAKTPRYFVAIELKLLLRLESSVLASNSAGLNYRCGSEALDPFSSPGKKLFFLATLASWRFLKNQT